MVIKKDDKAIEIEDLKSFPPNRWVNKKDENGGSYSANYSPHQNFKTRIASVKWGRWWSGANP